MQNSNDTQPKCRRCGDCCINGGPALHTQDLSLVQNGDIPLSAIVTLRPGERAYDQPAQRILPLEVEILKIKGRDGSWTCRFYSPEGRTCGMYDARPAECEVLFCQDISPLAEMYDKDRLTRRDLLPEGHPLLELVEEHETKCSPLRMEALAKAAREGDEESARQLKEMVVFDKEMRRLTTEKAGLDPEMNDFLFGRPLTVLLKTMSINTYETGDTIRFAFVHGA